MNYNEIFALSKIFFVLSGLGFIVFAILFVRFDVPYILRVLRRNMLLIMFIMCFGFSLDSHAMEIDEVGPKINSYIFRSENGDLRTLKQVNANTYIVNSTERIRGEINLEENGGINKDKTYLNINRKKADYYVANSTIYFSIEPDTNVNSSEIYTLMGRIFDRAGNYENIDLNIIVDTFVPTINTHIEDETFTDKDGTVFVSTQKSGDDIEISLEAVDDYFMDQLLVFVNGQELFRFDGENAAGKRTVFVALPEDSNTVDIKAMDYAGNKSSITFKVVKDASAPIVPKGENAIEVRDANGLLAINKRFMAYLSGEKVFLVSIKGITDDASGILDVAFFYEHDGQGTLVKANRVDDRYEALLNLPKDSKVSIFCIARDKLNQSSSNVKEDAKILSFSSPPRINISLPEKGVKVYENSVVYRKDCLIDVEVSDELAISDIFIKLGNKEVFNTRNLAEDTGEPKAFVNKKRISLDISKEAMEGESARLSIYANNYGGHSVCDETFIFYRDENAPKIGIIYADLMPLNSKDYAYFSKNNVNLSVSVNDYDDCGIERYGDLQVSFLLFNEDDKKILESEAKRGKNGQYEMDVEPGFKGYVKVVAKDTFGNQSEAVSSKFIIEGEKEHEIYSSLKLNRSDNIGVSKNDVDVIINATNTFCGIRDIEYSVEGVDDDKKNYKSVASFINNRFTDGFECEVSNGIAVSVTGRLPVRHDSNNIKIRVKVTDNAKRCTMKMLSLDIDKTKPVINLSFDDGQVTGLFNKPRTGYISIVEKNYNPKNLMVLVNGRSWNDKLRTHIFTDIAMTSVSSIYNYMLPFEDDGDYNVKLSFKDNAGNEVHLGPIDFSIDTSPPECEVTFSNTKVSGYYGAKRSAYISINEKHFDPMLFTINKTSDGKSESVAGKWESADGIHRMRLDFYENGEYEFSIRGKDQAENVMVEYHEDIFNIDLISPVISITGVSDRSANNKTVSPVISIRDENLDFESVKYDLELKGGKKVEVKSEEISINNGKLIRFHDIPHSQNYDGVYTLRGEGTDLAGNSVSKEISFSVNRFGSTYLVTNPGFYGNKSYSKNTGDLTIDEINIDNIDIGKLQAKILKNGNLYIPERDVDYTIEKKESGFKNCYTYRFNNNLFKEDGAYVLSLFSKDDAGNVNVLESGINGCKLAFGIDNTPPLAYILSPLEGEGSVNKGYAIAKDNLSLKDVELLVNNKITEYKKEGDLLEFDLKNVGDIKSISIRATDEAGNVSVLF